MPDLSSPRSWVFGTLPTASSRWLPSASGGPSLQASPTTMRPPSFFSSMHSALMRSSMPSRSMMARISCATSSSSRGSSFGAFSTTVTRDPALESVRGLLAHRVLALLHRRHVDAHAAGREAVVAAAPRDVRRARARDQRLGRDAAVVHAGAAEQLALDEGGLQPLLVEPGAERGRRLPDADDDGVHALGGHCAVQPPSIDSSAPVIDAAASLARNTASSATSSTATNRLVGCAASRISRLTCSSVMPRAFAVSGICFSTSGVQTYPGQIAFTVMPCSAASSATVLVSPARPCLAET